MRQITLKGGFDENLAYVLADDAGVSDEAMLIDAAVPASEILAAAAKEGLRIRRVFITHAHQDHWWSAPEVLKETGAELVMFRGTARQLGLTAPRVLEADDGDELEIGGRKLRLLHTPGHNPAHLCLYEPQDRLLFTGDTLFVGRTGRTVSAGADPRVLYRSLREKILPLPAETRFFPGHDYGPVPTRTLGEERRENRFLTAASEAEFVEIMERYERERRGG